MVTRWNDDDEAGLEIPARAEYVALARQFVSSLASSRQLLDEERIDNLKLAVSEACTNAIEAYHDPTGQHVRIRWRAGGDRLEVGVEDSGPGFDLRRLPRARGSRTSERREPTRQPARRPRLPAERGLGIRLIRSLVDEVTFQPSDQGTAVRLVMRCDPPGRTERNGGAGGHNGDLGPPRPA
jgi:serine/threonine-protein kinase RsbW